MQNPFHPSLEFRAKGMVWTVAIGRSCQAIARRFGNDLHWAWIGSHEDPQIRSALPCSNKWLIMLNSLQKNSEEGWIHDHPPACREF